MTNEIKNAICPLGYAIGMGCNYCSGHDECPVTGTDEDGFPICEIIAEA